VTSEKAKCAKGYIEGVVYVADALDQDAPRQKESLIP
jgi:hypothetical protein